MEEKELLEQLEDELELLEIGIVGGFWHSCPITLQRAKEIINLLKSELK